MVVTVRLGSVASAVARNLIPRPPVAVATLFALNSGIGVMFCPPRRQLVVLPSVASV